MRMWRKLMRYKRSIFLEEFLESPQKCQPPLPTHQLRYDKSEKGGQKKNRNYFELEIWIQDQMKIKFGENHKIIKQKKTNPVSIKVNSQHRLPCIETFLWEKKNEIFWQQLELSGLSFWFVIPWLFIRHTDWQQINMQTERRHGQREFWRT